MIPLYFFLLRTRTNRKQKRKRKIPSDDISQASQVISNDSELRVAELLNSIREKPECPLICITPLPNPRCHLGLHWVPTPVRVCVTSRSRAVGVSKSEPPALSVISIQGFGIFHPGHSRPARLPWRGAHRALPRAGAQRKHRESVVDSGRGCVKNYPEHTHIGLK